ncbi:MULTISPECIES: anthrone oxygenase family protein [Aerosakkonema]|uniref:anthrone oxygenase family protein n=1 Tax=Aerosakkonema TaxID=1246629 RepID=UPI0035B7F9D0
MLISSRISSDLEPFLSALAKVKPESIEAAKLWAQYLTDWTFWNHVRTLAALVAAVLLTFALCDRSLKL